MCKFCGTKKYRKIYQYHHGEIPTDDQGKTYEIHHIDGDHNNNHPSNLKAVSIEEHYQLHFANGDWAACLRMSHRMNLSKDQITDLAKKSNAVRIKNGTHPFLDGKRTKQLHAAGILKPPPIEKSKAYWKKRLEEGTHPFQNGERNRQIQQTRIANGTHHFLDKEAARQRCIKRVKNSTHPFIGGEIQRQTNRKMLEDGTHPFLNNPNPNQRKLTCPHCNRSGSAPGIKRWHFDRCKFKE